MTGWDALEAELAAWQSAGRRATFWWRDDDAVAPTPALERLLALAAVPLALAVIPAGAAEDLVRRLAAEPLVAVLQHGYAHENHSPPEAKKQELGGPRDPDAVAAELTLGKARLEMLFGPQFQPVLVPPWNRIDPGITARLPGLGYRGLSAYGPRAARAAAPGLPQVNCHADILRWKPTRGFLGTAAALALLTGHLAARRQGEADAEEPSGILSHHLVQDEEAWAFLAALLTFLADHPAAVLLSATEVFAGPAREAAQ